MTKSYISEKITAYVYIHTHIHIYKYTHTRQNIFHSEFISIYTTAEGLND